MKIHVKMILFLLVSVYIIPGTILYFIEGTYLPFYFITITATTVPYYIWAAHKKLSCRIFGYRLRF